MAAAAAVTSKLKRSKIKAVQQKVKLFRSKEPLLSVFMWGINYSVSVIVASCYIIMQNVAFHTALSHVININNERPT